MDSYGIRGKMEKKIKYSLKTKMDNKMNFYAIRISCPDLYPTLLKDVKSYVWCKHAADDDVNRDHYHYYIKTHLTSDAFRKRIREHPLYGTEDPEDHKRMMGNKFFALKTLVITEGFDYPVEPLGYLMKPSVKNCWTEDFEQLKEEIKKYCEEQNEKRKKNKANRKTVLQDMEDTFGYTVGDVTQHEVVSDVIRYYKEKGKLVREFAMVSQVQTLLLKYDPNYACILSFNISRQIDKTPLQ